MVTSIHSQKNYIKQSNIGQSNIGQTNFHNKSPNKLSKKYRYVTCSKYMVLSF